jgi:hypothetical protein
MAGDLWVWPPVDDGQPHLDVVGNANDTRDALGILLGLPLLVVATDEAGSVTTRPSP